MGASMHERTMVEESHISRDPVLLGLVSCRNRH
jgi:hypothetical protein